MKIEDVRLGMPPVTTGGLRGQVVAMEIEGGLWLETEDRTRFPAHVECVGEPCDAILTIAGIPIPVLYWSVAPKLTLGDKVCLHGKMKTVVGCSDSEDYWKPFAEVAKCYKQVEPEQLLLSEDAKIVCELLRSSGPASSFEISERLHMMERCVFESLIGAKEAGIVRLDDGKYSIVRETC